MIKELIIITAQYPTKEDPVFTFIRPVACGLADLGIHVSIMSPQSITNAIKRKVKIRPYHWVDYSEKGNSIDVYQPRHLSVSMLKIRGHLISQVLFERALRRAYRKIDYRPDLVYAHFWESVVAATYAISDRRIPVIAVSGEEHVSVYETYPEKRVNVAIQRVNGLICVSTKNLMECEELALTNNNIKTVILPNSIDNKVFHQIDRVKARKSLGWNEKDIIAIFVGEFSKRKGVNRVLEAAKRIPKLKLVLIGWGDPLIKSDQIIFSGKLAHDRIPLYLSASDFFVLPTLAEGCCNAIVEALACGLPVISSNCTFNYDILDKTNSILIDPNSVSDLANAMKQLYEDSSLRSLLSNGALKTAMSLSIELRVKKIAAFINDRVKAN